MVELRANACSFCYVLNTVRIDRSGLAKPECTAPKVTVIICRHARTEVGVEHVALLRRRFPHTSRRAWAQRRGIRDNCKSLLSHLLNNCVRCMSYCITALREHIALRTPLGRFLSIRASPVATAQRRE